MNEHTNMNGYMIEPWDHLMMTQSPDGSVHDQYVPPELETLARQVMENYDMSVSDMTLITAKPDKGGAIWRINTDKGPRSIKVLHRTPHRSLFSIGAQDYLVQQGARVPPLIPTKGGELYVNAGGKSWIVTDWVEPLQPVSKIDLTGVQELCRGLGEFHRLSRGYIPPFGSVKASRLYRWPQHYEKIITKLQWFEDIANVYSEFPAANTLLSILPQIQTEAADYYMMFRDSAYRRMIAKGEPHWGLAHQDYGWSNGQMGPGGIWIIDLDGVAYDIPIRDLRKLITSTMVDNGRWDITWVRAMIEAYHEGNPIDQETFELLWIDMAFPNEFYKHVKEIVYEPELFMQTELEPILNLIQAVEQNKWDVLNELRNDMAGYPAGDYPAVDEEPDIMVPTSLPGAAAVAPLPLPVTEEIPYVAMDTGAAWHMPEPLHETVFGATAPEFVPAPLAMESAVESAVESAPQQSVVVSDNIGIDQAPHSAQSSLVAQAMLTEPMLAEQVTRGGGSRSRRIRTARRIRKAGTTRRTRKNRKSRRSGRRTSASRTRSSGTRISSRHRRANLRRSGLSRTKAASNNQSKKKRVTPRRSANLRSAFLKSDHSRKKSGGNPGKSYSRSRRNHRSHREGAGRSTRIKTGRPMNHRKAG